MSNKGIMKKVGHRCREWRRAAGLRLQDIADATGYSIASVHQFELGCNNNARILLQYVSFGFRVEGGDLDDK